MEIKNMIVFFFEILDPRIALPSHIFSIHKTRTRDLA